MGTAENQPQSRSRGPQRPLSTVTAISVITAQAVADGTAIGGIPIKMTPTAICGAPSVIIEHENSFA